MSLKDTASCGSVASRAPLIGVVSAAMSCSAENGRRHAESKKTAMGSQAGPGASITTSSTVPAQPQADAEPRLGDAFLLLTRSCAFPHPVRSWGFQVGVMFLFCTHSTSPCRRRDTEWLHRHAPGGGGAPAPLMLAGLSRGPATLLAIWFLVARVSGKSGCQARQVPAQDPAPLRHSCTASTLLTLPCPAHPRRRFLHMAGALLHR